MTPYTSSEGMRQRYLSQSYEALADWELDLIVNPDFRAGHIGIYNIPEGARREYDKRQGQKRLELTWKQLEREGFGL